MRRKLLIPSAALGGLLLTSMATVAPSLAINAKDATISATSGWQSTGDYVNAGQTVSIQSDGSWTVDSQTAPYTGPEGYTPDEDSAIWQGCKIKRNLTYGVLLAKIDGKPLFDVGDSLVFKADASGYLKLRIHDGTKCLGDNDGFVDAVINVY